MIQDLPLQPLRIPTGWHVNYNDWVEIDPEAEGAVDHLSEDLLQLRSAASNLLVDVGWYGEGDRGSFGAVVYRGDFNGVLLAEFSSRSRSQVVAVVEVWLQRTWSSKHPDHSPTASESE